MQPATIGHQVQKLLVGTKNDALLVNRARTNLSLAAYGLESNGTPGQSIGSDGLVESNIKRALELHDTWNEKNASNYV